ncbi:MAG TPA: TauD/TfdA family dioxygenase [Euzebyales bacterium]
MTDADPQEGSSRVQVDARTLTVDLSDASRTFHHVWLRDNCWCDRCRVGQTCERRLFTADIADDIAPARAWVDADDALHIVWSDGHQSTFSRAWLARHDYGADARAGRQHRPVLWDAVSSRMPTFDHADVVGTTDGLLGWLDALRDRGVALVRHVPAVDGEVVRFAEAIAPVREVAFGRLHEVRQDPTGYSVAHTTLELKPHTDFPSYSWPPSLQLLHFLANDATGGESVVVDGWKVVEDLRATAPEAFATLSRVPVMFQQWSDDTDSAAVAPLIELDATGRVRTVRFSNQLASPLDAAFDQVEPFYAAYRRLGRMIDDPRYRVEFKCAAGDLLAVHGHRVLHGRLPFDLERGARHLQDVYMEFDDLMARRRVLRGEHLPLPAMDARSRGGYERALADADEPRPTTTAGAS